MLVLPRNDTSLQISLAGAVSANEADFVVSYENIDDKGRTTYGVNYGTTSGTTEVTALSAPLAGSQRIIKNIEIYNADTASVTVNVLFDVNGTNYQLLKYSLATLKSLFYTEPNGWTEGPSTLNLDHGANLTGLGDDDHTIYLLADGTRALAGAWDLGSFALTNVNIDSGTINGITDLALVDGGTGASSAADARTNLGLAIGTDVQAYDATLASIAGLGTAADKLAYTTGVDTWAETALTAFGRSILDDADEATFKATVNLEIGTDVQAYDADTAKLDVENQTLTGGVTVTTKDLGTQSSGTLTLDVGDRPLQKCVDGGAFTLAPGSTVGSTILQITNNASAGAITTSGFTKVSGDSFDTTDGSVFMCSVVVTSTVSLLQVVKVS